MLSENRQKPIKTDKKPTKNTDKNRQKTDKKYRQKADKTDKMSVLNFRNSEKPTNVGS